MIRDDDELIIEAETSIGSAVHGRWKSVPRLRKHFLRQEPSLTRWAARWGGSGQRPLTRIQPTAQIACRRCSARRLGQSRLGLFDSGGWLYVSPSTSAGISVPLPVAKGAVDDEHDLHPMPAVERGTVRPQGIADFCGAARRRVRPARGVRAFKKQAFGRATGRARLPARARPAG